MRQQGCAFGGERLKYGQNASHANAVVQDRTIWVGDAVVASGQQISSGTGGIYRYNCDDMTGASGVLIGQSECSKYGLHDLCLAARTVDIHRYRGTVSILKFNDLWSQAGKHLLVHKPINLYSSGGVRAIFYIRPNHSRASSQKGSAS